VKQRNWRLGSARVSRAGDGVPAIVNFFDVLAEGTVRLIKRKSVAAGRPNQHARRVHYPARIPHYSL
jgi:hypothetical protein